MLALKRKDYTQNCFFLFHSSFVKSVQSSVSTFSKYITCFRKEKSLLSNTGIFCVEIVRIFDN